MRATSCRSTSSPASCGRARTCGATCSPRSPSGCCRSALLAYERRGGARAARARRRRAAVRVAAAVAGRDVRVRARAARSWCGAPRRRRRRGGARARAARSRPPPLPLVYYAAAVAASTPRGSSRRRSTTCRAGRGGCSVAGLAPLAVPAAFAYRLPAPDFGAVALRAWPLAALLVYFQPFGTFPFHALQGLTPPLAVLGVLALRSWLGDASAAPAGRAVGVGRAAAAIGTAYRVGEPGRRRAPRPPAVLPHRRRSATRCATSTRVARARRRARAGLHRHRRARPTPGARRGSAPARGRRDQPGRTEEAEALFGGRLDAAAARGARAPVRRALRAQRLPRPRGHRRAGGRLHRAAAPLRLRDRLEGAVRPRFPHVDALRAVAALCIVAYHLAFVLGGFGSRARALVRPASTSACRSSSRSRASCSTGRGSAARLAGERGAVEPRVRRAARAADRARVLGRADAHRAAPGALERVRVAGRGRRTTALLQGYDAERFTGGIGPAWTLTIEVAFYVLLPFFALAMRRVPGGVRSELVRARRRGGGVARLQGAGAQRGRCRRADVPGAALGPACAARHVRARHGACGPQRGGPREGGRRLLARRARRVLALGAVDAGRGDGARAGRALAAERGRGDAPGARRVRRHGPARVAAARCGSGSSPTASTSGIWTRSASSWRRGCPPAWSWWPGPRSPSPSGRRAGTALERYAQRLGHRRRLSRAARCRRRWRGALRDRADRRRRAARRPVRARALARRLLRRSEAVGGHRGVGARRRGGGRRAAAAAPLAARDRGARRARRPARVDAGLVRVGAAACPGGGRRSSGWRSTSACSSRRRRCFAGRWRPRVVPALARGHRRRHALRPVGAAAARRVRPDAVAGGHGPPRPAAHVLERDGRVGGDRARPLRAARRRPAARAAWACSPPRRRAARRGARALVLARGDRRRADRPRRARLARADAARAAGGRHRAAAAASPGSWRPRCPRCGRRGRARVGGRSCCSPCSSPARRRRCCSSRRSARGDAGRRAAPRPCAPWLVAAPSSPRVLVARAPPRSRAGPGTADTGRDGHAPRRAPASNRYAYWKVGAARVRRRAAAGHGSGLVRRADGCASATVHEVVRDAHSLELETAAELGLVGLALLGLLLGGVVAGGGRGAPGPQARCGSPARSRAAVWAPTARSTGTGRCRR